MAELRTARRRPHVLACAVAVVLAVGLGGCRTGQDDDAGGPR